MKSTVQIYDPSIKKELKGVTMSASAIAYVKKQIAKQHAIGFRVGIKKAGCSGLKYRVDYVFEKKADDHVFQIEPDLAIYIDEESLPALDGIKIDYMIEGLNSTLKFINPNETGSCGCGESFSIKE